jgi:hypothetical protein
MKSFVLSCLAVAVVVGGSANAAFSCGGQGGATGCKVATMPLTTDDVVGFIRWLDLVIP